MILFLQIKKKILIFVASEIKNYRALIGFLISGTFLNNILYLHLGHLFSI
jgi:hypothetical protein